MRFKLFVVEGGIVKDDDFLHGGAFLEDGADLGQVVARNQDPLGIRMVDTEDEVFSFSQIHRQGNVHGAGVQGSHFRQHPHGAAFGKEGDLVSFLYAQRHEACADAVNLPAGFVVGDSFPAAVHLLAEIDVIRIFLGVLLDEVYDGNSFCHFRRVYSDGKRP